jgi:hypothetical protein
MPKFESGTGTHVRVIRPDAPDIDIDDDGYETDDKDEIQALRDSPEVKEIKTSKASKKKAG